MSNTNIKNVKPNGKFKSGKFVPRNPEKYIGDIHNIIYRSSWEGKFCQYCDQNPNIIKWASEAIQIEYWNPVDKKTHIYHPDYYIKTQKTDGTTEDWIIEIKPASQYQLDKKPVLKGPMTEKRILSHNEQMKTWIVNRAKFDAAMNFAKYNGYRFGAIDENFVYR
jgi:hypothetical protein